jgi:hypothetical protein
MGLTRPKSLREVVGWIRVDLFWLDHAQPERRNPVR